MNIKSNKNDLKKLPGVDIILKEEKIEELVLLYGRELVTDVIREVINDARNSVLEGENVPGIDRFVAKVSAMVNAVTSPSLKRIVNATGVVIHTNLGRAPLGKKVFDEVKDIVVGYSNLEFNLKKGSRGKRNEHVVFLLKFITGAEDVLVVNNNAAAIVLALNTLANGKEVIISRGELIEIGGSFRIPEIMEASGAEMVEVGTTNKTHLSDYEKAITENTAMILKVHKSNYAIEGFTEDVPLKELIKCAHSNGIPVLYDIGSGLLRKSANLYLKGEPDVRTSIAEGVDLITFSGDKLLGGPQAGIVAGKKELISRLNQVPMMRALRVGKLTLAILSSVIRCYLNDQTLKNSLPIFLMLERTEEGLKKSAKVLFNKFTASGIKAKVVKSVGQCGGGTLPTLKINSYAVALTSEHNSKKDRSVFAENVFHKLLELSYPVIGVLRQGVILFDVLTLSEEDFHYITSSVSKAVLSEEKT